MQNREVYGTSGPRILLWFDLLNAGGSAGARTPMGSTAELVHAPIFQVRAVGSLEQNPGCPAASGEALGAERLEYLCRGECYNPGEARRLITRIEVVRVRPQVVAGEPIAPLIEDAWRTFACDPNPSGCSITFSDPDFERSGRDALYYVRAIEEPIDAINVDSLRCVYDDAGRCISVDACTGDAPASDDCLGETEQRAWSSPIFVEWSSAPESGGSL